MKTNIKLVGNYFEKADAVQKLTLLGHVVKSITDNHYANIISFGSGTCIFEYLLKLCVPYEIDITCLEYNTKEVEIASKTFNCLTVKEFDMNKDVLDDYFDLALFINSSAHISPERYVILLNNIKEMGVMEIFDMSSYTHFKTVKRWKNGYDWYKRSLGEYCRMYNKTGFDIIDRFKVGEKGIVHNCKVGLI